MPSRPAIVAVDRVVAATPQEVFDLLADPSLHPMLDGSGSVRAAPADNPGRLALGVRFGMSMRMVLPYRVSNVVVEFEESRLIAWRHFAGHRWRYTLSAVAGGTLVREEWDCTRVPWLWPALRLLGFPDRNRAGMRATLHRLSEALAAQTS